MLDLKDYRSVPAGQLHSLHYAEDDPEEDENDFGNSQAEQEEDSLGDDGDVAGEEEEGSQEDPESGQEHEESSDDYEEGSEGEVPAASPRD